MHTACTSRQINRKLDSDAQFCVRTARIGLYDFLVDRSMIDSTVGGYSRWCTRLRIFVRRISLMRGGSSIRLETRIPSRDLGNSVVNLETNIFSVASRRAGVLFWQFRRLDFFPRLWNLIPEILSFAIKYVFSLNNRSITLRAHFSCTDHLFFSSVFRRET